MKRGTSATCWEILSRHSKSFTLAARLLPREERNWAAAVYAYCRRADDAVDLPGGEDAVTAVERMRRELIALYESEHEIEEDPVLEAFRAVAAQRRIPRAYPEELLAGLAMDAAGALHHTLDDLLLYCYRVAGTVGLMMCHALGIARERALHHAAHLGMAMQLCNVCRDVGEDWARGRLYLPSALLNAEGWPDLASHLGGPFPEGARAPVGRTIRRLLREADRHYLSGDRGLLELSWRCSLAVRTASRVYSAIGDRIRESNIDPLEDRSVVPAATKLAVVGGSVLEAGAELPHRLARRLSRRPRRAIPRTRLTEDEVLSRARRWPRC